MIKNPSLLSGYKSYTSPAAVQKSAIDESQMGFVGTSVTVTVSASVSWTFSWSF